MTANDHSEYRDLIASARAAGAVRASREADLEAARDASETAWVTQDIARRAVEDGDRSLAALDARCQANADEHRAWNACTVAERALREAEVAAEAAAQKLDSVNGPTDAVSAAVQAARDACRRSLADTWSDDEAQRVEAISVVGRDRVGDVDAL